MTEDVDQLNLFANHESRVLSQGFSKRTANVPAVIITGFLGAGKTTLVRHLLRNRGLCRIAVLINEVGSTDIDSHLADLHQAHASAGITAASLAPMSGGCICCTAKGGLASSLAALQRAASTPTGTAFDYLVVETSGVADAEPLAAVLASHGFRLESIVAVVDAEAGLAALGEQAVAQAQVRCADVVLLNKCDVADLGAVADVEDEIQKLSPGVRSVRCRHGQVSPDLILDMPSPFSSSSTSPAPSRSLLLPGSSAHPQSLPLRPLHPQAQYDMPHTQSLSLSQSDGHETVPGAQAPSHPSQLPAKKSMQENSNLPLAHSKEKEDAPSFEDDVRDRKGGGSAQGEIAFLSHEPLMAGPHHGLHGGTGDISSNGLSRPEKMAKVTRDCWPGRISQQGTGQQEAEVKVSSVDGCTHSPMHSHPHPHSHSGVQTPYPGSSSSSLHITTPRAATYPAANPNAGACANSQADAHDHDHAHAQLHVGYFTEVVSTKEAPIPLSCFQTWARAVVQTKSVLRVKGWVWVREWRARSTIFQMSGRQRAECLQDGEWPGSPRTQLVLIGTCEADLKFLKSRLQSLIESQTEEGRATGSVREDCSQADLDLARKVLEGLHPHLQVESLNSEIGGEKAQERTEYQKVHQQQQQLAMSQPVAIGQKQQERQRAQQTGRLQWQPEEEAIPSPHPLPPLPSPSGPASSSTSSTLDPSLSSPPSSSSPPPILTLSVKGDPLHGVNGPAVCSGIMRQVNSHLGETGILMVGVPQPPLVSALTGVTLQGERMAMLMFCLSSGCSVTSCLGGCPLCLGTRGDGVVQQEKKKDGVEPFLGEGLKGEQLGLGAALGNGLARGEQQELLRSKLGAGSGNGREGGPGQVDKERGREKMFVLGCFPVVVKALVKVLRSSFPSMSCKCDVISLSSYA